MQLSLETLKGLFPNSFLDQHKENLMAKCPWCNYQEFGIELAKNHRFNCFRKSKCGESGNVFKLLTKIGRTDLLGNFGIESLKYDERLENIIDKKIERNLDLSVPKISAPIGWKRVYSNYYLENRDFELFDKFEIGTTKLDLKLKDHVICLIKECGELKAYVARITKSKEEIKDLEEKIGKRVSRYRNSPNVDFTKLLEGIDEITVNTHTVIIVEGFFGKEAVDRHLKLDDQDEVKCCCTFGAKLSEEQIFKLQLKGIKHIILFFDIDVINKIKKYAMQYLHEFETVKIIHSDNPDKDPADLTYDEMIKIYNNKIDPVNFHLNKVQVLNLK